jgi:hypothetical protein
MDDGPSALKLRSDSLVASSYLMKTAVEARKPVGRKARQQILPFLLLKWFTV